MRFFAVARVLALAVGVVLAASIFITPGRADDAPSITITGLQNTADEGKPVTFKLTLAGGVEGNDYVVKWHVVNGTATIADDLTAPTNGSKTLTAKASGAETATITIQTKQDSTFEPDEDFTVAIECPDAGCTDGATASGSAKGTINNDDPKPTISIASASQLEGNSGTNPMPFAVALSNPSSTPITFHVATSSGSALDGEDFTGISSDFTIAAGKTQPDPGVQVQIKGDTKFEDDETFTVQILSAGGATIGNGCAGDDQERRPGAAAAPAADRQRREHQRQGGHRRHDERDVRRQALAVGGRHRHVQVGDGRRDSQGR